MATGLTVAQQQKQTCDLIMSRAEAICRGASMRVDKRRLLGVLCNHVMSNPQIVDCDKGSILQACADAISHSWEIGRDAYLVPFKGKVSLIPSWKGLIDLANRSGQLSKPPKVQFVYEGEAFSMSLIDGEESYNHRADIANQYRQTNDVNKITHVYCCVTLRSGATVRHMMTRQQIESHRKRYVKNTKPDSIWVTDWSAAASKTLLRMMVNRRMLPISVEDIRLVQQDEEIENSEAIEGSFVPVDDAMLSGAIESMAVNSPEVTTLDMASYETAMASTKTAAEVNGLYDSTFGPQASAQFTDEQEKEGRALRDTRLTVLRNTK